jgi:hypothetical protein
MSAKPNPGDFYIDVGCCILRNMDPVEQFTIWVTKTRDEALSLGAK